MCKNITPTGCTLAHRSPKRAGAENRSRGCLPKWKFASISVWFNYQIISYNSNLVFPVRKIGKNLKAIKFKLMVNLDSDLPAEPERRNVIKYQSKFNPSLGYSFFSQRAIKSGVIHYRPTQQSAIGQIWIYYLANSIQFLAKVRKPVNFHFNKHRAQFARCVQFIDATNIVIITWCAFRSLTQRGFHAEVVLSATQLGISIINSLSNALSLHSFADDDEESSSKKVTERNRIIRATALTFTCRNPNQHSLRILMAA